MMRKILLFISTLLALSMYGQEIKTENTTDWNTVYKSGFYESLTGNSQNNPAHNNSPGIWFWGINTAHKPNGINYRFNGQILFRVNIGSDAIPEVHVRSTNQQGAGIWAKVLHSKGNHAIDGKLTAKEIEIKVNTGADFVFAPEYNLRPLSEIKSFVIENKHLPEIPSEKQMIENGVDIGEMQIKLLQKIEELTLYVIEQNEQVKKLQSENENQNKLIEELQNKIN